MKKWKASINQFYIRQVGTSPFQIRVRFKGFKNTVQDGRTAEFELKDKKNFPL